MLIVLQVISVSLLYIEDVGTAFEIVYNNETNEVEIYMYIQSVYWYNEKMERWMT